MEFRFKSDVNIRLRDVDLKGELTMPRNARALVIFAHGSGSTRKSPRNQAVAKRLHDQGFGTLLFDLLTPFEASNYSRRFDIRLLTERLSGATRWAQNHSSVKDCVIGYFGASTGAASALKAASFLPQVKAIVSRGGRPDLVMEKLPFVHAPTLLIVGSLDYDVLRLNQAAYEKLGGEKDLEIVEGATHLFEELGMMDKVTALAIKWFAKYLKPVSLARSSL